MQRPHCYSHGNSGFPIGKGYAVRVQPCLMDKHENVAEIQHSQLSPLLHSWTLGGFHKNQEILHCDALLLWFSSVQHWDKAAFVWIKHAILCFTF